MTEVTRTIILPSGRKAEVRKGKGRDLMRAIAQWRILPNRCRFSFALIAELTPNRCKGIGVMKTFLRWSSTTCWH